MIENIISGIIATLFCSAIFKVLDWIKRKPKEKEGSNYGDEEITLRKLSIARKQFFISLAYLFAVIIALTFNVFIYDFLVTFILVTAFFSFILLWGSFDAIFYPLKRVLYESKNELSNKDS